MTNEVIKVAKCFGVPVEAEIGELLRLDDAGTVMENKNIVDPEEVRRYLSLCQPDSLQSALVMLMVIIKASRISIWRY